MAAARMLLLALALAGCSFDQPGDDGPPLNPGDVHCPGEMVCDPSGACKCGGVARPEADAGREVL